MYIVFVVFFVCVCVGELCFFYPLNSLNGVRICAGTPYSAPKDLQNNIVWLQDFCGIQKKKKIGAILKNFAKTVKKKIFGLFV